MRLLVEKMGALRQPFRFRLPADELNCQLLLTEMYKESLFCADALIEFQLVRVAQRILLDGHLSAELSTECGRCLDPITLSLHEDFSLALNLVTDPDQLETPAAVDSILNEEQMNSLPVVEGRVDLRPVLQEQLLLHLPLHPVCESECAGLCPHCGINFNRESCQCRPLPFHSRFGQLKGLKIS